MTPPRTAWPRPASVSRRVAQVILGAACAVMVLAADRSFAGESARVGGVGLLSLPDGAAPPAPIAVVIALHDPNGIDPRGWRYDDQITAAGIAVLHVELLETSADGFMLAAMPDEAAVALARLAMVIDLVATDPRFAHAPVGLLAFGASGRVAILAAADPAHPDRIAAVALLYPGCAALAATVATEDLRPRAPILLLHGDVDPANPPADCISLAARLAGTAPVRRAEYVGAGYAWDLPPSGPHEVLKLPWPGRPGALVAASHWPKAAELSATQAASFFAAALAAQPQ